jgi:hypothetical protein
MSKKPTPNLDISSMLAKIKLELDCLEKVKLKKESDCK